MADSPEQKPKRRSQRGGSRSRSQRQVKQRRRGTAIMEYPKGILVVSRNGKGFLTPGGKANRNESRMQATIREVKEETGVEPYFSMVLFRYDGPKRATHQNVHTVYYVKAKGTPKPHEEITTIEYYSEKSKPKLSRETEAIIKRFLKLKQERAELFAMIDSI